MLKSLGFFLVLTGVITSSPRLLAAGFSADCTQLMKALVQAERSEKLAEQMRKPDAGLSKAFLGEKAVPWIGYFFPFQKGGIARRWQVPGAGAPERLMSEEIGGTGNEQAAAVKRALQAMSETELAQLSPAEKMDIYLGHYDFRITRQELERRGPRRAMKPADWEGFCNGRCAAGMLVKEPVNAVKVKNADGIVVNFEPNDIKALLTSSYFYVEDYAQMGAPNRAAKGVNLSERVDPGAFDMALRSMIGEAERPFVVDIEPGTEIWNYLAVGYERSLGAAKEVAARPDGMPEAVVYEMPVRTRVFYVNDIQNVARHNSETTALIKPGAYPYIFPKDYPYTLWLDADQKIVGGAWKNERELPDFAWFPTGKGTDSTQGSNPHIPFEAVMELQRKSTAKRASAKD